MLAGLVSAHPGLQAQLLTSDGDLNRFVNAFLNDVDIRHLEALDTPVGDADTLVLLPAIGRIKPVRDYIDANESRGINPGAMYYTELDAMPRIIDDVDRKRESASEAFWRPSRTRTAR